MLDPATLAGEVLLTVLLRPEVVLDRSILVRDVLDCATLARDILDYVAIGGSDAPPHYYGRRQYSNSLLLREMHLTVLLLHKRFSTMLLQQEAMLDHSSPMGDVLNHVALATRGSA